MEYPTIWDHRDISATEPFFGLTDDEYKIIGY